MLVALETILRLTSRVILQEGLYFSLFCVSSVILVDLHRSKPLISLVPFNLQLVDYMTIPIVFPANQKQSFK